jgi:hypothetical protein
LKSNPIVLACALWVLTACSAGSQTTSNPSTLQNKTEVSSMEKISNAVYDGESVTVTVISTGCTQASHFAVEHQLVGDRCEITVVRTEPDRCRRAPTPITVGIAWSAPAECDDASLFFMNPILKTGNRALDRTLD